MDSRRITYLVALAGSAAWCLAIISAPLCASHGGALKTCGDVLYEFFRPVCHQIAGRSLMIAGEPLAVCSRCSAVYFSFLLGTLLFPLARKAWRRLPEGRTLLLLALLPMLLDVFAGVLGVHDATETTRLLTGAWLGVLLPFVVLPVAMDGFTALRVRFFRLHPHFQKGNRNA
jgi:uncharacterized membrane protein